MKDIRWLDEPEEHDYPAAESYLSLIFVPQQAAVIVGMLRDAKVTKFKAKDILRASGLKLLDADNRHVQKNWHKVEKDVKLSPLLVVRFQPVIVADGFHRLCFAYRYDEDVEIPLKIV